MRGVGAMPDASSELAQWIKAGGEAELLAARPDQTVAAAHTSVQLSAAERLLDHAVDRALCGALTELEPFERLVLRLRWGAAGRSRDQAAALLGCSPDAVLNAERRGAAGLDGNRDRRLTLAATGDPRP